MKLSRVSIKNFRSLKNTFINLNDSFSIIIGPNNVGKTSILSLFEKVINNNNFIWEDVNLEHQKKIFEYINDNNCEDNFIELINVKFYIQYSKEDSFHNIYKYILDLDENNNYIVFEYKLILKNIDKLGNRLRDQIEKEKYFNRYINDNFNVYTESEYFIRRFIPDGNEKKIYSVLNDDDLLDENILKKCKNGDLKKIINIHGIKADRSVSNDKNNNLSIKINNYFQKIKDANIKINDNEITHIFDKLDDTIFNTDRVLNDIYNGTGDNTDHRQRLNNGIFSNIIDKTTEYGIDNSDIHISIDSNLSDIDLLKNNIKLHYKQDGRMLPETHNGLGYLNLISIIFDIENIIKDFENDNACINVLYIEEPEAHTHPQLQYIFMKQIITHICSIKINKQVIITTHSSQIVTQCKFQDIIYLYKKNNNINIKYFKDIYSEKEADNVQFIQKYLTLTKCELFFANKIICIEGPTERILLSWIIEQYYKDHKENLSTQNISILEIGGAFAHKFFEFFDFLNAKVLIITDLDTVKKKNGQEKAKAIQINNNNINDDNITTSNKTITDFFKVDEIKFRTLLQKSSDQKIDGNRRIAYQIPEDGSSIKDIPGRSFEEAFLIIDKNKQFVLENWVRLYDYNAVSVTEKTINDKLKGKNNIDQITIIAENIKSKANFATSLLFLNKNNEIKIPKYIYEGLEWLFKN